MLFNVWAVSIGISSIFRARRLLTLFKVYELRPFWLQNDDILVLIVHVMLLSMEANETI